MRKIDINECHKRLLDIAKAVHEIGERHGIIVYMLGGTMLGAIRHKGFIPWDDDMDFAVMYDRYWEFADILKKELPVRFACRTFEDHPAVTSMFFQIEDTETRSEDPMNPLPEDQQIGLNIDIFPIVRCSEEAYKIQIPKIQRWDRVTRWLFLKTLRRNWKGKLAYHFLANKYLLALLPFDRKTLLRKQMSIMKQIQPGDVVANPMSPHFRQIHLKPVYFDKLVKYDFEDTKFYGVSMYDEYLSLLYKDYMKIPPKEKQRVHLDNVYLK